MHTFTHPITYTRTSPPAQGEAQLSPLDSADISALDDAQLSALDAALNYRPSRKCRKHFTRVLVRKLGRKTYTTVCLDDEYFLVAMRFAYEEMSVLTTTLRKAALLVKDDRPGHFSRAVRARALLSLQGNYQPRWAAALALAKADAAQILANVNNAAWSTAQA